MDEQVHREQLRTAFEAVAERYDEARPTYPAPLLDDLVELTGVPAGGRILEIGPGTGKASVALARRGYALLGVELGPQLAEVARRNLAAFPQARIVVADFEHWEPPRPEEFDAVVAFTAFHWIAPELRYAKPARLLREGGALAVVQTNHVVPASADPFWTDVQADYDAVVPHEDSRRSPPAPEEVRDLQAEIEATGLYHDVEVRRRLWEVEYGADEYIAVLGTYSNNVALPAAQRDELFARIHARIAAQGRVTKTYLATLNVARKS